MDWCRRSATLAFVAGLIAAPIPAGGQPILPAPAYDNTTYVLVYGENLGNADAFDAGADQILQRAQPGPYAKTGFADYFALDMPWAGSPAAAPLNGPSEALLRSILDRAAAHDLAFHISAMAGVSRAVWTYTDAKREDRRNAQWFGDGTIVPPGFSGDREAQLGTAYATPSRYARKLRRHLETKVRAFATRFLALRAAYPGTLVSASGDAEAELNSEAENPALPYDDQLIADYSPFAILEFRDWLLHAGLYADDGPYADDGYEKKADDTFDQGADALSQANLTKFDGEFWTPFGTWELKYFPWSLTDPIDADPQALSAARTAAAGWSPLPTGGADLLPAGFDAPRYRNQYSPRLWDLWLEFRATMLANYARDFATWMTTTKGANGETLAPERWYSHQIPGDYLNGTRPGAPNPERRLITSASPFWTSLVGDDVGSPGVTVLDRLEADSFGRSTYRRTSQYLFDAIAALHLPNWGMPEYSPSWNIDIAPETSATAITLQYLRASSAGAHLLAFTPWPHFTDTQNGKALGDFVARVKFQPRGAGPTAFAPPPVTGLSGSATQTTASLSWSAQIFPGVADFAWSQWPSFRQFEVWRGSQAGFTTTDGHPVRVAIQPTATGIPLSAAAKYYKILAVTRDGKRGPLSEAILLEPGSTGTNPPGVPAPNPSLTPAPSPTPGAGGATTHAVLTCRLLDTRYGGDPDLVPLEVRVLDARAKCGIPAEATSIVATLLVLSPPEAGSLVIDPGDARTGQPLDLAFSARRSLSTRLSFALTDGLLQLESRAPTQPIDVMLLVSAYSTPAGVR